MVTPGRVCFARLRRPCYASTARGTPLRRAKWNFERNRALANIKSQKKRILTNEKARMRNKAVRSELKTAIRRVDEAVAAGDKAAATAAADNAARKLDKAVTKGVIHKNQAANRKSGIVKRVNALA
jgi:small subunit ribosomal protein S20